MDIAQPTPETDRPTRRKPSHSAKKEPEAKGSGDAERYLKRLDSAQSGIKNAFIAFIALIAFWLTIEIGFIEYKDIRTQFRALKSDIAEADLQIRDLNILQDDASLLNKTAQNQTLSNQAINLDRERKVNQKEKAEDAKEKLQAKTLDLSILGTKLPSTINFAPQVWLAVLSLTMLFLLSYRQGVYRNLAHMSVALGSSPARFGYAGDGSPLMAPLPGAYEMPATDLAPQGHCVTRADFKALLGWSDRAERYAGMLFIVFSAIVVGLAVRITYFAFVTTQAEAIDAEFIDPLMASAGRPLALSLLGLTIFVFLIIFFRRTTDEAQVRLERRTALGVLLAAAFFTIIPTIPSLFESAKDGGKKRTRSRIRGRQNRFFVRSALTPGALAVCGLPRSAQLPRQVRWVGPRGTVRFWSSASDVRLVEVEPNRSIGDGRTSLRLMTRPDRTEILGSGSTIAFEAAALSMAQYRRMEQALDCLLLGCRIEARSLSKGSLNLRLFNLGVGLWLRHGSNPGEALSSPQSELIRKELAEVLDAISKPVASLAASIPSAQASGSEVRIIRQSKRLVELGRLIDNPDSPWAKRWLDRSKPRIWKLPIANPNSTSNSAKRTLVIAFSL